MAVLVDSNVLLDLISEDPSWYAWSEAALRKAANSTRLVINAVIYNEISVRYTRIEDLEAALPKDLIAREHLPYEAAFLAAKAFAEYRTRGGTRTTALPDFFIGAHAAVSGYELLTRDATRFRTYFPKLKLIAPT